MFEVLGVVTSAVRFSVIVKFLQQVVVAFYGNKFIEKVAFSSMLDL